MKLGTLDFDPAVLQAARNATLVVFAGAGVSKGDPAGLPLFDELAQRIADGTGREPEANQPLDRFLGELQGQGVEVHRLAAEILSPPGLRPTDLHRDLVRLFPSAAGVRIVTTNFDLLFEKAARGVFGEPSPPVFAAPALPRGRDFAGIVHVHGAFPDERTFVLTDADFGRAYLTEGWARRFLLDLFLQCTVLFVGYSHDDTVLRYLARALPPAAERRRFILTDDDKPQDWALLGLQPILFGKADYSQLGEGVARLAERVRRSALAWRSRVGALASQPPEVLDSEAEGEIEEALASPHLVTAFTRAAGLQEWGQWLASHGHFDRIFSAGGALPPVDGFLVDWLVSRATGTSPATFFELLGARESLALHPDVWWRLARRLGCEPGECLLEDGLLGHWVSLLLETLPVGADLTPLVWVAQTCVAHSRHELAASVFLALCAHRLKLQRAYRPTGEAEESARARLDARLLPRSTVSELRELLVALDLAHVCVAERLLRGVVLELDHLHQRLSLWGRGSRTWDSNSSLRHAIDPHEQDRDTSVFDLLVDVGRDILARLAHHRPAAHRGWLDSLVLSEAPILRRLALHAVSEDPSRTPDERLIWLLETTGLDAVAEHHEIYFCLSKNYGQASGSVRRQVVEAVLGFENGDDYEGISGKTLTDRSRYGLFEWMLRVRPRCQYARRAFRAIEREYPQWKPHKYPDLTHWSEGVSRVVHKSARSPGDLLVRPASEQLDDLLAIEDGPEGTDRVGLQAAVAEAVALDGNWGVGLGAELARRGSWEVDLWRPLLGQWATVDLADNLFSVLQILACEGLQQSRPNDVARILSRLPAAGDFRRQYRQTADAIAAHLWAQAPSPGDAESGEPAGWLSSTVGTTVQFVAEYWLRSWARAADDEGDRNAVSSYRDFLEPALTAACSKGNMVRTYLCSQVHLLASLDEDWTRVHVVPLFADPAGDRFAQAWDGFLTWGRLTPTSAAQMEPSVLDGLGRFRSLADELQVNYIHLCAAMVMFFVPDPCAFLSRVLPKLLDSERKLFADEIGHLLGRLQPEEVQKLWSAWLGGYVKGRCDGVPIGLSGGEVQAMISWLPQLGPVFGEAVEEIVRCPPCDLERSDAIYRLQQEGDLFRSNPETGRRLLLYLCECRWPYSSDLRSLAELLPQKDPQVLEALARIGQDPIS